MSMDKIFEKYKKPRISYSEFKEKNYNNLYKFNNTEKIKNKSKLKLCIGVIIIIFVFSLGFMLRGGNEPKEKVIVNFIVEGVSYEVEIENGSLINKELIPLSNKELVLELYYDEKMEREYNFETIEDDIIIYVKVIKNNIDDIVEINVENDINNITNMNTGSLNQMTYLFYNKIERINRAVSSFYKAELNYNNYYVLCGYMKEESYIPDRWRNLHYGNRVWKTFKNIEEIEYSYEDMILSDVYLISNIIVFEDIVSNEKIEKKYKYYEDITKEYLNAEKFNKDFTNIVFLLWYNKNLNEQENVFFTEWNYELSYNIVCDNNSEVYIIFDNEVVYENESYNVLKKEFNEYYEILKSNFIYDESLNESVQNNKGENYIITKVKINIVDILKIIEEGK